MDITIEFGSQDITLDEDVLADAITNTYEFTSSVENIVDQHIENYDFSRVLDTSEIADEVVNTREFGRQLTDAVREELADAIDSALDDSDMARDIRTLEDKVRDLQERAEMEGNVLDDQGLTQEERITLLEGQIVEQTERWVHRLTVETELRARLDEVEQVLSRAAAFVESLGAFAPRFDVAEALGIDTSKPEAMDHWPELRDELTETEQEADRNAAEARAVLCRCTPNRSCALECFHTNGCEAEGHEPNDGFFSYRHVGS